jgi:hypothetical protein
MILEGTAFRDGGRVPRSEGMGADVPAHAISSQIPRTPSDPGNTRSA